MESVVSKRRRLVADDDDEQQLSYFDCSERLSCMDDDDMPIVVDDDDKDTAGVSVGVTGKQTIGVADGVGGWAKKGIDSSEYSRELMKNAEFAIRNNKSSSIDLMKVLSEAYSKTKAKGSSTACILTLANDTLHDEMTASPNLITYPVTDLLVSTHAP
ncbi:hypothetical protein CQW23_02446 [Capsicum baccatum]|uniref:Protein phosphatase n=1 Tax=Capsicum baccatum TaxID=33114 RepID=A0A2G2XRG4_CAPBA|nr:hypothetical protein CQW23_02446 [Capsicum baccatum]